MANERYKSVSTFVLPDEYQRQAAEARRRRRMAEMLAQQAYQPEDISAPIPAAAPLVQGLQAYLTARSARKADEAEEAAGAAAEQTGQQIAGRLMGGRPLTGANTVPDASGLAEVAVQSQYRADPEEAMRMGMTPAGRAAMKGNPMLASMLAQTMKKPKGLQIGNIDPSKFTPQSIAAAINSNDPSLLKLIPDVKTSRIGKPAPEDFTPGSLAEFNKTGDYSVLVPNPKAGTSVNIRYGTPMAAVDKQGNTVFLQPSQTGGPPSVISGYKPVVPTPALNESQSNAAGFADRIANAIPELDRLPPDRSAIVAEGLPLGLGSSRVTDKDKRFFQAERSFINAVLRKESGAAIGENEFESARRQYIPQPGDGPEVLKQKRIERQTALRSMSRAAGSAYKPENFVEEEIIKLPPRR